MAINFQQAEFIRSATAPGGFCRTLQCGEVLGY